MTNSELIAKYPWLEDDKGNCWYDDIPEGWAKAFGEDWCKDIDKAISLMTPEQQKDFQILQLKEKFGTFRQYIFPRTPELDKVVYKYERRSWYTCIECGAPATLISTEWVNPFCENCAAKHPNIEFVKREFF